MKTKELPGDKFEKIYNAYYMKFEAVGMFTFHNLLWQLIVNEVKKDEKVILSTNYEVNGQELVFVNEGEGGYIKTHVAFLTNVDYKHGYLIAKELTELIFGIDSKEYDRILDLSFQIN